MNFAIPNPNNPYHNPFNNSYSINNPQNFMEAPYTNSYNNNGIQDYYTNNNNSLLQSAAEIGLGAGAFLLTDWLIKNFKADKSTKSGSKDQNSSNTEVNTKVYSPVIEKHSTSSKTKTIERQPSNVTIIKKRKNNKPTQPPSNTNTTPVTPNTNNQPKPAIRTRPAVFVPAKTLSISQQRFNNKFLSVINQLQFVKPTSNLGSKVAPIDYQASADKDGFETIYSILDSDNTKDDGYHRCTWESFKPFFEKAKKITPGAIKASKHLGGGKDGLGRLLCSMMGGYFTADETKPGKNQVLPGFKNTLSTSVDGTPGTAPKGKMPGTYSEFLDQVEVGDRILRKDVNNANKKYDHYFFVVWDPHKGEKMLASITGTTTTPNTFDSLPGVHRVSLKYIWNNQEKYQWFQTVDRNELKRIRKD